MAIINGTSGNDQLQGTSDTDTINGLDGNDTILSSAGNDADDGGGGDDIIFAGRGNQTFNGGDGFDRVSFSNLAPGIAGGPASGSGVDVDLATGVATFSFFVAGGPPPVSTTYTYALSNVEGVGGTAAGDTLRAGATGSELAGLGGDDILIGRAGADTLIGGTGRDTLTGGGGADVFKFSADFSQVSPNGAFVDSTIGAIDSITDFQTGLDLLDLTGVQGLSTVSLARSGSGTLVFASSNAAPSLPTASSQTVIGVNGTIQGGDVYVNGTNPGLQLIGDDRVDILIGGAGNDQLFGLGGSDMLNGGAGDDQLFGDAGADVLTGGAGADRFAYRSAADSNATDGYDIVTDFTGGTDKIDLTYLNGLRSVSLVRVSGGTFLFAATDAGQVQVGFIGPVQGTDLINPVGTPASFGYDIVGAGGGESLIGSTGNDRLFGLGDADLLFGGAGDDILYGDAGADRLTGGTGADVFAYRSITDSPSNGFDVITDFVSQVDKIDLRSLHTSGADKYGFAVSGADTVLFFDQGGDGINEIMIVLQNITNLKVGDILF